MLDIVLTIFTVIAIGWLARRTGVLAPGSHKALNDFVYYISMPALILGRLMTTPIGAGQVTLLLANALPIILITAIVLVLAKLKLLSPKLAGALLITSFFGNIIFMGFPVVELRYGTPALADAAIITFVANLLVFTLGLACVGLISNKSWMEFAKERLSRNALIFSCIIGAAVSVLGLVPPAWLTSLLTLLGGTTSPVALFSMGVFLYGQKLSTRYKELGLLTVFKLVLFPILVVASIRIFGLTGTPSGVSLLEALMPLAVTNFIIAEKFDLDAGLVAEAILLTTILCIPLLLGYDPLAAFVLPA